MGEIFDVKCGQCDYKFRTDVGHGLRGCGFFETNPETNKPYYYDYIRSKKIIADINNIVETQNDVEEDAYAHRKQWHGHGSAQYFCRKCRKLHNKFYFKLVFLGGTYEPIYSCSKCRNKLILVELMSDKNEQIIIKFGQDIINWQCPKCDNNKLIFGNYSVLYD